MAKGKNRVKLGPNDVRVGNFIYHDEKDHIKIVDINDTVSHRISKFIAKGQVIVAAMVSAEDAQKRFLENYAVVTFNLLSCVPDQQLFMEVNASSVNCINRHPEIYGIKEKIGEKEDAEILNEERELNEALEEAKKDLRNESAESEDKEA